MLNDIILVAITGGPCGGKSTFLAKVHEYLQSYGIYVIVVSEIATELINAGINPGLIGIENFEKGIIDYQIFKENKYCSMSVEIAKKSPVVILCDRGALDCAAYLEKDSFQKIRKNFGYLKSDLLNRYKLVIHLTTAALGAENFYTLENNTARKESVQEAIELDKKTELAWLGHPHHIIIDNCTGFEEKILRAVKALARGINMPEPTEIERKFKFINFVEDFVPADSVVLQITQDYLVGAPERRVRCSEFAGEKTFFYTEKVKTSQPGKRFERESIIPFQRYQEYLFEKDPGLETIVKKRYCFIHSGKKFELDIYKKPGSINGLVILEVEIQDFNERIDFPREWELEEVTGKEMFDNKNLAKFRA